MNEKINNQVFKTGKDGFYELKVDKNQNRLFITFFGRWESPEQVPDYIDDFKKTLRFVKEGYTSLCLIEDEKPPKLAVTNLHKQVMKLCMDAKYSKMAICLPTAKPLQQMSTKVIGKLAGFKFKIFNDKKKALDYIDGKIEG